MQVSSAAASVTDPGPRRFIAVTRALAAQRHLGVLLEGEIVKRPRSGFVAADDVVIAWGCKPTANVAEDFARKRSLPFLRIEDGFLRSIEPGRAAQPLSIVVDALGIYYDCSRASGLERLAVRTLSAQESERADRLVARWRQGRVSKYNHAREYAEPLPERYVLVVDQTCGDASIRLGQADAAAFTRMLAAALAEYPDCTVIVKAHPDVVSGRKRGHFHPQQLSGHPRVRVVATDAHPVRLIEGARAVYTVTSQLGFEALLWGKPVRTFGMPFYAGWGLTDDELPTPDRRSPVSLQQLVFAALVAYPRYCDPESARRCEVETVLDYLALQRRMRERFPAELSALGFSCWKRPLVRRFLAGSHVTFHRDIAAVPDDAVVVLWGDAPAPPQLRGQTLIRLEDGFLRSVGLGVDLVRPLSWVMDGEGIYYDSCRASGLETLLSETTFDEGLLARADQLRRRIVAADLTKYNVGAGSWQRPAQLAAPVILVPGQVESDASIRRGGALVRTNLDLLRAVRNDNPGAYLLYKPHPDVAAGLRRRGAGEERVLEYCDAIVREVPMAQLLAVVDEVHLLTSLTGFEALLRGRRVVTYGQPFYAGWGLTEDKAPPPRRKRKLSLAELVAGTLILYPTYVSRTTGAFTTPERALEELLTWREHRAPAVPLWRRVWRLLLRTGVVRR